MVEIPRAELLLRTPALDVPLCNQTCHVLFNSNTEKEAFHSSISDNGRKEKTLVLDCDLNFASTGAVGDAVSVFGPDELTLKLENLYLDPTKSTNLQYLELLVIENISVFYWGLKLSKKLKFFVEIADLVTKISERLGCNVITTSWDSDFDKGYNYNRVRAARGLNEKDPKLLQALSFLPLQYFERVGVVVHYGLSCVLSREE